jgi:hypothetical protein
LHSGITTRKKNSVAVGEAAGSTSDTDTGAWLLWFAGEQIVRATTTRVPSRSPTATQWCARRSLSYAKRALALPIRVSPGAGKRHSE